MFTPLPYFDPFLIANPTLPKLYWEVKSPEQLTANLYCIINALKDYVNDTSGQVNENSAAIDTLEMLFEKFMQSGFDDYYAQQIEEWINDNVKWLWQTFGQMMFAGLTDDGHFCIYVPDSWSDITFDTGAVYGTEDYGRLILRYETSGQGVIDNTAPNYPNENVASDIARLQKEIKEVKHTLYTALTDAEVAKK